MCGIFGILGSNNIDIDKSVESIRHRGPDSSGKYTDKMLSLGFRRLAIIDLSIQGNQPMSNEDSSIEVVFNGEIYNYLELKSNLMGNHRFKSDADSEVLVHGYEEWGIRKLLKKLNGMFAFCLYDKKRNISFLARDRIGKKPLYYYKKNKYLAFSSETKAFFKLPKFSFTLDDNSLDLWLGFPYLPDNKKTLIKDVYKIEPGTYLKINITEKITSESIKYWDLPNIFLDDTFENTSNNLEELLIDSVQKRLVADVPVGILLSGGLDSSLITALASKYSNSTVSTLNISFKNSDINESAYASQVAKYCKTKHINLNLDIQNSYKEFKDFIWIFDDLSTVDGGLFSTYLLCKSAREQGIKVVLVGEGADEVFGGYSFFQLSQYPFKLAPQILKSFAYYYSIMRISTNKNFLKFPYLLNKNLNESSGDFFKKIQYNEIKYSLPNHYCMKLDKGSMAASVEARAPFLDYRIVELAVKTPSEYLLHTNMFNPRIPNEKYILRKIASKYLPSKIYVRKKKGGMLPTNEILNKGLEIDSDIVTGNEILNSLLGRDYLYKLIKNKPKNKFLNWQREWILWKSLVFSLWFNYYKEYEN